MSGILADAASQYRQRFVDDYRRAAQAVIPAETAAAYDQEIAG
ncbi:MAG TPA: hypothetical protein VJZ76_05230 [Thermoanaerobaculia bacterium]|nr:hypothetical protein [Thermoanaerobaculia bacterium]